MADDRKVSTSVRLTPPLAERLTALADRWHVSQSDVLAHGVDLLTDPAIGAAVGDAFQSAEQGLRCWAALLTQAAADNAQTFSREEWNLVADSNNGCSPLVTMTGEDFRGGFGPTLLWANVEDDIRLNGADRKWLGSGKAATRRGAALVEKLRGLDFVHDWAVIVAVQWFWSHCETIDHQTDEWWTATFRRGHSEAVVESQRGRQDRPDPREQ